MNNNNIPEIEIKLKKTKSGKLILQYNVEMELRISELLKEPVLKVALQYPDGHRFIYPVFQQNAGIFEEYSDYMNHHGCACCSLTTMLNARLEKKEETLSEETKVEKETKVQEELIYPQHTIEKYERACFGDSSFAENYQKSLPKQMPVSLYGISQILQENGIENRYVGAYKEKEAMREILAHLYSGRPVIFEASRLRHRGPIVLSINDKKYSGSYHTMIMLGIDQEGLVVFTDSATREWAGDIQRLKRARLSELMMYMFSQKNKKDTHVYFHGRRNTGGYILL